jgi:hypothetical protein
MFELVIEILLAEDATAARAYRVREQPADLQEIDRRQRTAELTLVELEAAAAEGKLIPLEQHVAVVAELASALRAVLIAVPSTYALDLERAGLPSAVGQALLERIADGVTAALRHAAEGLVEEAEG